MGGRGGHKFLDLGSQDPKSQLSANLSEGHPNYIMGSKGTAIWLEYVK